MVPFETSWHEILLAVHRRVARRRRENQLSVSFEGVWWAISRVVRYNTIQRHTWYTLCSCTLKHFLHETATFLLPRSVRKTLAAFWTSLSRAHTLTAHR